VQWCCAPGNVVYVLSWLDVVVPKTCRSHQLLCCAPLLWQRCTTARGHSAHQTRAARDAVMHCTAGMSCAVGTTCAAGLNSTACDAGGVPGAPQQDPPPDAVRSCQVSRCLSAELLLPFFPPDQHVLRSCVAASVVPHLMVLHAICSAAALSCRRVNSCTCWYCLVHALHPVLLRCWMQAAVNTELTPHTSPAAPAAPATTRMS
jgi:hypothetical protein